MLDSIENNIPNPTCQSPRHGEIGQQERMEI